MINNGLTYSADPNYIYYSDGTTEKSVIKVEFKEYGNIYVARIYVTSSASTEMGIYNIRANFNDAINVIVSSDISNNVTIKKNSKDNNSLYFEVNSSVKSRRYEITVELLTPSGSVEITSAKGAFVES